MAMSEGAKTPENGTLQAVPKTGAFNGPEIGTVTRTSDAPELAPTRRVGEPLREGFDEGPGLGRTVTDRVVPRDTSGTDSGQSSDDAVTPCGQAADAVKMDYGYVGPTMTLEEAHERQREDGLRGWLGITRLQEDARLDGRHGLTWWDATAFIRAKHFTAAELAAIRAAFDEGVELRRRNVRCYCNRCITPVKLVENERKRGLYAQRRRGELAAQGYTAAEVTKRVLEEIDRGMAL